MNGLKRCRMIRTRLVAGAARVRGSEVVLPAEEAAAEARRGSLVILEAVEGEVKVEAVEQAPAEEANPSDAPAGERVRPGRGGVRQPKSIPLEEGR